MPETVYKYTLPPEDVFEVQLPAGASVLHFAPQHDTPCMWVRLDPQQPKVMRRFFIVGTGHPIPEPKYDYSKKPAYIDSCLYMNDSLVWHLFEDMEAGYDIKPRQ